MTENHFFVHLDRDWAVLAVSSPARVALRCWRATDDRLPPFEHLGEVVAYVQRRGRPADSDAVLSALARLAPREELAARALLQAVLPGLKAVVLSHGRPWDREELTSLVVCRAWDRIRAYPIERRPRHIAANILLDVRQTMLRSARKNAREADRLSEEALVDLAEESIPSAAEELLELVVDSVRAGHLAREDAQLLLANRVAGVSLVELGVQFAHHVGTMRKRRSAAEQRLLAAVCASDQAA